MVRRILSIASLAAAGLSIAMAADYQFIVEESQLASVPSYAASPATSFDTGALSTESSVMGLEARFQTREASVGVALNSTKSFGSVLIVR